MNVRLFIAAGLVACVLGGCSFGSQRRITPSQVTIQELVAQPDGEWRVTLRIQNFSTVSMHYASLHGTLAIAGADVGTIDVKPDVDIPQNSADVLDVRIKASTALPAKDFDYRISGTIDTSEPKETFKFDRSSRLSPAPGLSNTWR
jgi:formate-dependent phosphoribosylglycinamide formyltransferase (GAR transformylase)